MVDDIRHLVYLHPTRTGGTSVESMLVHGRCDLRHYQEKYMAEHGFRSWGGVTQHFTMEEMGEIPDDYITFVTVRNPYCRAASIRAYNGGRPLSEILRHCPNNAITQAQYAIGARYWVKICDGERENIEWLEQVSGQKLKHVNGRPSHPLTSEEVQLVRSHYESDFKLLEYDMDDIPHNFI